MDMVGKRRKGRPKQRWTDSNLIEKGLPGGETGQLGGD